jgi:LPXTG-motif cell wall-anchored protein
VILSALVIGFVRFSTIYLFSHHVWITYLVVAALSIGGGFFIWRKRRPVSLRK